MDPPLQLMLVARPPRGSSVESTVQEKALSASSSRPGGAPRTLVGSMEMVLPLIRSFTSATTGSVKFGGVPVSCASEAEVLVGECRRDG